MILTETRNSTPKRASVSSKRLNALKRPRRQEPSLSDFTIDQWICLQIENGITES